MILAVSPKKMVLHMKEGRQQLDRVISFRDYFAIGFGVIVGVGWVVYAGHWLMGGGVLGSILAFLIGGSMLVPVGKCYAELTAALPLTGGEVAFTFKAFGPAVSFHTAWALALMYIFVTPFETIAVGAMVEAIVPSIVSDTLYSVRGYSIGWSNIIPGLLAGVWVIWLNWRGARDMARFQTLMTMGLLSCTVIFCLLAFWKGDISNMWPLFSQPGNWWVAGPASIASVLVVVPFFLAGFDTIPQAAEESGLTVQPKQLGTAIVMTIVIGTVFYVMILIALGFSVSHAELSGIVEKKDVLPMAYVFRESFGFEWAAQLVLLAALLGIMSTLNGIFMAATRLLFSLGRGGLLPHWFSSLHETHHTPANAIKFVGFIALAGPFVGKAGLIVIVNAGSLVLGIVLLIVALTTLKLRKTAPDLARPYKVARITIWLAILMGMFLVGLMTLPGSPGQMGKEEFICVVIWMALGSSFYFIRQYQDSMDPEKQAYQILGDYR
jgi:amino acid transporter